MSLGGVGQFFHLREGKTQYYRKPFELWTLQSIPQVGFFLFVHTTTFYFGVGWLKVQTLPHFEQNEALQRPLVKRVSTVKTDHVGALRLVKREERIVRP